MERNLLWSALALGGVTYLCNLLLLRSGPRATERTATRFLLLLAAVLPFVVLLLTLPARPPFSPGQGWGRGFFLGGVGALLSSWAVFRGAPAAKETLAATFSLAVVAASLSLLLLRASVIDALVGVAIGWFVVSFVLYVALSDSRERSIPLAAGAGFAATLCALAALGIYRDPLTPAVPRGMWSALGLMIAAAIPFLLFVGALLTRSARFPRLGTMLLALLLLAGLGKLLSVKAVTEPRLVPALAVGLVLGPVAWWVVRDALARNRPMNPGSSIGLPPLAILLIVSGFLVAFQLLQGFGVGLFVVGLWLSVGFLSTDEPAATAATDVPARGYLCLLLFALVLLLYRLFASRFAGDLRGVSLTDHYAFFGFIVGAALPGLLAGPLLPAPSPAKPLRGGQGEKEGVGQQSSFFSPSPMSAANEAAARSEATQWAGGRGLLFTGALTLVAPGTIVLLWGAKCALALLAGLALGGVQAFGWHPEKMPGRSLLPSLLSVAVALALAQWTGHLLPASDLTRAEKVRILVYIVSGLLLLLVAADYGGRLRRGRSSLPAGDEVAS